MMRNILIMQEFSSQDFFIRNVKAATSKYILCLFLPNFFYTLHRSFVLKLFLQINCYFTEKNTVNCNYTKCSTFEVFGCKLFQSTTIS